MFIFKRFKLAMKQKGWKSLYWLIFLGFVLHEVQTLKLRRKITYEIIPMRVILALRK